MNESVATKNGLLLDVQELQTHFFLREGTARAVDGVSFSITRGETLGLVGESGCGKSVTALSIIDLVPSPPGKRIGGRIVFDGENLMSKTGREMRVVRGNQISMIFQEPLSALNPVLTVGNQLMEVFQIHKRLSRREARAESLRMLERVQIPSPQRRLQQYPHELSGGMCQRIMIAMALACQPQLLIADEPTTALDVTVQARILDLMNEMKEQLGSSILLITHDLGIVAETARHVVVMYAGEVVESASVESLFAHPLHPYTQCLLQSLPWPDRMSEGLKSIPGNVPSPLEFPPGCRFHPRCPKAFEACSATHPQLLSKENGCQVRCLLYE